MKSVAVTASIAALALAGVCRAQAPPEMPAPVKEHEWLRQLVGEWKSEGKALAEPGQPPLECKGTESVRMIGGFWVIAENHGTPPGTDLEMTGVMTVGYDPEKNKYVGTWVDSMTSRMWHYEGRLDSTGKILTLEAEGPNFIEPGKTARFRDVIEIKDKDHKVFTSSMQGADGKWTTFMTSTSERVK